MRWLDASSRTEVQTPQECDIRGSRDLHTRGASHVCSSLPTTFWHTVRYCTQSTMYAEPGLNICARSTFVLLRTAALQRNSVLLSRISHQCNFRFLPECSNPPCLMRQPAMPHAATPNAFILQISRTLRIVMRRCGRGSVSRTPSSSSLCFLL